MHWSVQLSDKWHVIECCLCILVFFLNLTAVRAQEEKILNVYNWSDYISDTIVADFEGRARPHPRMDTL